MTKPLLRTDKEIADIYACHVKTVYRICFAYMKNSVDAEDAVQDTFIKLINYSGIFENEAHEKAWLIKTATNVCLDHLRHWWRRRESLEAHEDLQYLQSFEIDNTFEAVMNLPERYKTVVYLYYYEGYTSVDISKILNKPQSTIRNHLHEARDILRKKLGGDFDD